MWPFSVGFPEHNVANISNQEYDYIIVGGGTAGCVVASRLSENRDMRVLVIERGPVQDTWLSRVPLLSSVTEGSYTTFRNAEGNPGNNQRETPLYAAEALGGSSRLNGMIYTRGVPADYNRWAEMGRTNWGWTDVEPYFAKVEAKVQKCQHPPTFELYDYVDKSASALGLAIEPAANSTTRSAFGCFKLDQTIDKGGYRHSAFRAYLPTELAIQRHTHLTVCTNAIVSRLVLDSSRELVTGVYIKPSKHGAQVSDEVFVKAKREVIICGGAICTPQILQLSGIGPASLLNRHHILVKYDLPGVGAHLKDHHAVPISLELPFTQTIHLLEKSILQVIIHILLFLFTGGGWLRLGVAQSAIFLNTSSLDNNEFIMQPGNTQHDASKPENIPDVEVLIVPASSVPKAHPGKSLLSFHTCLTRPESAGMVEIRSTDSETSPTIVLNALADAKDLKVARKAIRFTIHLAEYFMKKSGYPHKASLFQAPNAGTNRNWRELSDEEIDEFAMAHTTSAFHLGGSCRMAKEEDGGVVDDELRVYGFRNLRIADASVFPELPSAHIMAPIYMVAERCADFIKKSWEHDQ